MKGFKYFAFKVNIICQLELFKYFLLYITAINENAIHMVCCKNLVYYNFKIFEKHADIRFKYTMISIKLYLFIYNILILKCPTIALKTTLQESVLFEMISSHLPYFVIGWVLNVKFIIHLNYISIHRIFNVSVVKRLSSLFIIKVRNLKK